MKEVEFLQKNEIEIQVKRFDNDVYIHNESVIDLLKGYKEQLTLTSVGVRSEQLKENKRLDYDSWKKSKGYERFGCPVLKNGDTYIFRDTYIFYFFTIILVSSNSVSNPF